MAMNPLSARARQGSLGGGVPQQLLERIEALEGQLSNLPEGFDPSGILEQIGWLNDEINRLDQAVDFAEAATDQVAARVTVAEAEIPAVRNIAQTALDQALPLEALVPWLPSNPLPDGWQIVVTDLAGTGFDLISRTTIPLALPTAIAEIYPRVYTVGQGTYIIDLSTKWQDAASYETGPLPANVVQSGASGNILTISTETALDEVTIHTWGRNIRGRALEPLSFPLRVDAVVEAPDLTGGSLTVEDGDLVIISPEVTGIPTPTVAFTLTRDGDDVLDEIGGGRIPNATPGFYEARWLATNSEGSVETFATATIAGEPTADFITDEDAVIVAREPQPVTVTSTATFETDQDAVEVVGA